MNEQANVLINFFVIEWREPLEDSSKEHSCLLYCVWLETQYKLGKAKWKRILRKDKNCSF